MQITLEIKCPTCLSDSIKKNGFKLYGKKNGQCKNCKCQFIGDHALNYQIRSKQNYYESFEVDEFWTFVGNKANK